MTRPTFAHIDLSALRANYQLARRLHGGRALAVIKANAYGHGAIKCAKALEGVADAFAVALTSEALELRLAGITRPILVLEGFFDLDELTVMVTNNIWTVIHQQKQIDILTRANLAAASVNTWLKVDSGMHRAGFSPDTVHAAYEQLNKLQTVASITLMTHFARADEPQSDATAKQIVTFDQATAGLPGDRSLCNSGGILAWPAAKRDWARVGIMLYGADPMPSPQNGLKPVMTLTSKVFDVRTIAPGEPVGYGAKFIANTTTRVGLVAIGYADGYPRSAPTGTPVAVDKKLTRIIGRVSMDMLTVDLTDLPEAGIGSLVELWGNQVDVNLVAQQAGTISYELLCNVKRVKRVYLDNTI
jgi:alanine racemase